MALLEAGWEAVEAGPSGIAGPFEVGEVRQQVHGSSLAEPCCDPLLTSKPNNINVQGCSWYWGRALYGERLERATHPHIAWVDKAFPLIHPVSDNISK